ncbi:amidase [Streptomyces sp. NBC_01775]|uniref:amidase n=1 Tax=Streptomyces sp. NBC_01775 TaxID=2975939 RepID=UPI002DDAA8B2|nr:amidase [Streptomyces sp. NBC_01775]WSB76079.1 amidase [Streptomyces sp. NBC_01775]
MRQPFATLTEAAEALRTGKISSRELVEAALADAEVLDPLLGVYVNRFPEEALTAAKAADARPARERGPLHGLPLALKDNFAAAEGPVTAQSPAHDPSWWRGRDAPAVARLRAAGAVVLGKTTLTEYAMGRPDPRHAFPLPRNPWDPRCWTGGSSTGNGAGIATGLFLGALGTDTSGSVRLPAALCGTTGLKTTFGLVDKDGVLPLSPTQDVVGPMGVAAADCALLLDVLVPPEHPGAPRPARPPLGDGSGEGLRGLRVGVPFALLEDEAVSVECRAAFEAALETLRNAGAVVVDFALPEFETLLAESTVTMLAEAFAEHGERLGARWADHGRVFRRLAAAGALVPAHLYLRAQHSRRRTRAALLERLRGPGGADLIATPTWPAAARPYTRESAPGDELNLTAVWNPAGFPALALPMGADPAGLPLSLQLVGEPHAERLLLAAGDAYQRRTSWHLRRAAPDPAQRPDAVPDPDARRGLLADRDPGADLGADPGADPAGEVPGETGAAVEAALADAGLALDPGEPAAVAALARVLARSGRLLTAPAR